MTIQSLKDFMKHGGVVIDTRHQTAFTEGFIPQSIFIGLNGRFAEWVGNLVKPDQPIALVTEPARKRNPLCALPALVLKM